MKQFTMIICLVMLSACDAMQQNGERAGAGLHNAYNDTRYKVSRYIYGEKPAEVDYSDVPPAAATFCYQAQFEVMCYDRPKSELHLNLIAVHGEHNYSYQDFMPNNIRSNFPAQVSNHNMNNDIVMSDIVNHSAGVSKATFANSIDGRYTPSN
jgi:hypothetical protein